MADPYLKQEENAIHVRDRQKRLRGFISSEPFSLQAFYRRLFSIGMVSIDRIVGPSEIIDNYFLVHRRDNCLPSPTPVKAAPAEHKKQHDDQNDDPGSAHGSIASFRF
jgi:hypothetical protein